MKKKKVKKILKLILLQHAREKILEYGDNDIARKMLIQIEKLESEVRNGSKNR
jgi:hypothetical protein